MLFRLLLLFIAVPFVELALLLYLADVTSWQFTLALVIVTGIVGTLLARSQGWHTYQRIQSELAAGRLPAHSMLDAVMIFVAGALLLTPGVLTDLLGVSLLLPPCRAFYRRRLLQWIKARFRVEAYGDWPSPSGGSEVIDSYVIEDSSEDRSSGESEGRR